MLKNVKIYALNEHKQVAILKYLEDCGLDNGTISITMNTATIKNIEDTFNVSVKKLFKEAM